MLQEAKQRGLRQEREATCHCWGTDVEKGEKRCPVPLGAQSSPVASQGEVGAQPDNLRN